MLGNSAMSFWMASHWQVGRAAKRGKYAACQSLDRSASRGLREGIHRTFRVPALRLAYEFKFWYPSLSPRTLSPDITLNESSKIIELDHCNCSQLQLVGGSDFEAGGGVSL